MHTYFHMDGTREKAPVLLACSKRNPSTVCEIPVVSLQRVHVSNLNENLQKRRQLWAVSEGCLGQQPGHRLGRHGGKHLSQHFNEAGLTHWLEMWLLRSRIPSRNSLVMSSGPALLRSCHPTIAQPTNEPAVWLKQPNTPQAAPWRLTEGTAFCSRLTGKCQRDWTPGRVHLRPCVALTAAA